MPVQTVTEAVLYRALRIAQIVQGAGRTASPEQFNDALISLNGLIDSLGIQRDAITTIRASRYTLSPSQAFYTIGQDPAGVLTADFDAPAPIRIDRARLVLAGSPDDTFLYLQVGTDQDYASLGVRSVTSTIPTMLYCDYGVPLARLYFWPVPTQANDVEIWDWQPLEQFETVDDDAVFPPGYADMLVYQLAVRMADQFGTELRPNVLATANKLLGRVKALNEIPPPISSADSGTSCGSGGGFNYMSGQ